MTSFKILDVTPDDEQIIGQIAELLGNGFRESATSYRTIEEAFTEVRDSLQPQRMSRMALDELGTVSGWIGGIEEYGGNVWELRPLVVRPNWQRQGLGRALVADFENQVAQRGGHTV